MALSILDLFVLSMLDRGLATSYELQREAGLSLGGTLPALRRLTNAGLLIKAEAKSPTRRPRHEYRLTPPGKDKARKGWKEHLSAAKVAADVDSLLRLVDVADHYKAPRSEIVAFLRLPLASVNICLSRPILHWPTTRRKPRRTSGFGWHATSSALRLRPLS